MCTILPYTVEPRDTVHRTVNNWLAGINFWHTLNSAPWLGKRIVRVTCVAVSKLQPASKPKRPLVTLEQMHALRRGLDLTSAFDASGITSHYNNATCCNTKEYIVLYIAYFVYISNMELCSDLYVNIMNTIAIMQ